MADLVDGIMEGLAEGLLLGLLLGFDEGEGEGLLLGCSDGAAVAFPLLAEFECPTTTTSAEAAPKRVARVTMAVVLIFISRCTG